MTRSKSRTRVFRVATVAAVILGGMVPVTGFAVENMIGRQSQNEGIRVLPVPSGAEHD